MRALWGLMWRDLCLGFSRPGELMQPPMFFVLVIAMFPLGIGPGPQTLALIAPGVIWVAALLATLLSMERLFRSDYEDGTLEQMLLCSAPLPLLVLGRLFVHWLLTGLPLLVVSPLLATMLFLPTEALPTLMLSLLLGMPLLSLIGAIGVALTVGLSRGGVLLTLLVLPLYVPALIFGASAVAASASGLDASGQLALLGAMLVLAVTLAPLAIAAALRISLD